MPPIQSQVEATKIELTREILKQYELLKIQTLIKNKSRRVVKSNPSFGNDQTNSSTATPPNISKTAKQEEQLKTKLWKVWIDQTQESKLKVKMLNKFLSEIKSQANDIVLALQSLNSSAATLTLLHFLIQNKLAKISGFVELIDQPIYYQNSAGQSIPIGNLELTEIEFEKQKIYTHHFKSVKKIGDIALVKIETLPKMSTEKAEVLLEELIVKIRA